jgi:hypothetical protein
MTKADFERLDTAGTVVGSFEVTLTDGAFTADIE